jgi:ATP-dependent exoDNAse (exonuclease V) beta subunit
MRQAAADGQITMTEGVIDVAVQGADGWRIVDWKTDSVDGAVWESRVAGYEAQVTAYAQMVETLAGQPVTGSIQRVRK